MRGGYYRPMHLHRARIGFDERGKVLAWDHVIVGQSITTGSVFEQFQVKDGIDGTATEGMRDPYPLPMRLTVHHPKLNVPVLWWRSGLHPHRLRDGDLDRRDRAHHEPGPGGLPNGFVRRQAPAPPRRAADGGRQERLRQDAPARRPRLVWRCTSPSRPSWPVVEASVRDGRPVLHRVTAGVHCNLAVNPRTVEAQLQGAAVMGLSMCLPGAAITLKDGVVEQGNFGDFTVARMSDIPAFDVHIVPSAEPPTGMGEPGLPPLAPAFAKPSRG